MKTIKKCLFGLLALGFVFAGCEGMSTGTSVNLDLHGTWESADRTSPYSGKLVIDYDTITITGYDESQSPRWNPWEDDQRPFKDFAKNVPLLCYTENGKLFIEKVGGEQSVLPYTYTRSGQDRFLRFKFGDREEGLIRTGY
jgi:hypothetical protein